jgi:O-antigen ligase
MIGALTLALALLYCFVWLRIPDVAGVAFPIQRLVAWGCGFALLGHLLLKGKLFVGSLGRGFLAGVLAFLIFLLLTLVEQLAFGETFSLLYFLMDFSKWLAVFAVAFACYYALATGLVSVEGIHRAVIASGVVATGLVFLLLVAYLAGFRSTNELIFPSFGDALGVWPTSGRLPRLAGTSAEPQQLSVLLLTPLLLMVTRERVARFWPAAGLALLAILLSQSKFAVISLAFLALYVYLVYERHRRLILTGALLAIPLIVLALLRLPTFTETLSQGRDAMAFVERLENLLLLFDIIRHHLFFGIGAGNYGVYRGITVYGDPHYAPGYTPNMDFLKVFAETGVLGFVLVTAFVAALLRRFVVVYRVVPPEQRDRYLAYLLGAAAIVANMMIGYELLHVFFWINVGVLMYLAETALAPAQMAPAQTPPTQTHAA